MAASPSPVPPHVRLAAPADVPVIRDLASRIWNAVYPGIITREQIDYMLNWMYAEDTLREEIREKDVRYFLMAAGGDDVAFAAYGPQEAVGLAKLHKLYLLPELHGRGLGSRLLQHVHRHAAEAGYTRMILQVNKRNRDAIRAYRRNGYTTERDAVFDIGNGFVMDDYVMARDL